MGLLHSGFGFSLFVRTTVCHSMETVLRQEDVRLITLKYPCMYQERLPHMQISPMHVMKLQAVH